MVTTAEKVMNIMVKHWIIYGTIAETENKSDFEIYIGWEKNTGSFYIQILSSKINACR